MDNTIVERIDGITKIEGRTCTYDTYEIRDEILAFSKVETISEKDWIEESLKGSGNAIVPQLIYQFYQAIERIDRSSKE